MIGKELGHFEITAKLGEGGMGEVYRAQDTKLGRDVALKILPERFMADPDRLARFKREARVLASLTHPNVAAIHEVGEDGTVHYLVMELVEGETLAERIARGPLPPGDACAVALAIARAVEAAHARGIVHRDLKPANVKIAPGGGVKVLDFGLAKALEPEPASAGATSLANSPTLTNQATQAGVLLGTAAYMSPEQARGREADRRSDIWALGVVLYEMLTGRKAFSGDTMSDVLASVLKIETDWNRLPPDLHPELRRLLERCLEKDLDRRLHDVADARVVLEDAVAGRLPEPASFETASRPLPARTRWPALAGGIAVGAVLTVLAAWVLWPAATPLPLRKIELERGTSGSVSHPEISPDGRWIAYSREAGSLWLRDLHKLAPVEVPGSNDASLAFWSPDSKWIAFSTGKRLFKYPVEGGSATTVARLPDGMDGGAWMPDGRIVFTSGSSSGNTGMYEVSDQGGDPRVVLEPGEEEEDFHDAAALPDGRGVLFVVHRNEGMDTIDVFDGKRRVRVVQLPGGILFQPVYSTTGHVLFHRSGDVSGLWALPFSLASLTATGEPFLVEEEGSRASVSRDGTLVYRLHGAPQLTRLLWVDRAGKPLDEVLGPAAQRLDVLSPDGRRLVYTVREDEQMDFWVLDLEQRTPVRLTFDGASKSWPQWSPDGRRIVYMSRPEGGERRLIVRAADGSTGEQEVGKGTVPAFTPDGSGIVYAARGPENDWDIWLLSPLDGDPKPLIQGKENQFMPRVSPDGRFLAYLSEESGRDNVYLTRFPEPDGKWQVSRNGGQRFQWAADGSRLYYLEDRGATMALMETDVTTEPEITVGRPRELFTVEDRNVAAAPDGRRFVVAVRSDQEDSFSSVVMVQNWFEEFRRRQRR